MLGAADNMVGGRLVEAIFAAECFEGVEASGVDGVGDGVGYLVGAEKDETVLGEGVLDGEELGRLLGEELEGEKTWLGKDTEDGVGANDGFDGGIS